MVTSRRELWTSLKTSRRADHAGESGPIAVQIAGTDAVMMAEAAAYNIDRGAQIIDINMGCPAKKVCNKWAGSALMQDEALACADCAGCGGHLCAACGVPVTLKMRTGWNSENRSAVTLARAFESAGVQMLTVHGRTREQGYKGHAEYETVAAVKAAVNASCGGQRRCQYASTGARRTRPHGGRCVDDRTFCTGSSVDLPRSSALPGHGQGSGAAARGRGASLAAGSSAGSLRTVWRIHRRAQCPKAHRLVRQGASLRGDFLAAMNRIEDSDAQWQAVAGYFEELAQSMDRMPAAVAAGEDLDETVEATA
jgi:tRNA-dihydrouridine synthase B